MGPSDNRSVLCSCLEAVDYEDASHSSLFTVLLNSLKRRTYFAAETFLFKFYSFICFLRN